MADETHPVIELLIARMQSHPKEFTEPPLRWETFIEDARIHACPEDHKLLQTALSKVCMDKLHEIVMDELLNGEERRAALAEQEKDTTLARQALLYQKMQAAQQQQIAAAQALYPTTAASSVANSYGFLGNSYAQAEPSLTLGQTTLNEKTLMEVIKQLTKGKGK